MAISSKDIGIPFVIGLMCNVLSAYLFSLQKININTLILILAGSAVVIIVIGIQLKTGEIKDELENQKLEQKKLSEKLKIYERLSKLENEVFK